jgi:hypothetical protein
MLLPQFFRTYKHKQFTYIPRFYDQQKEELQERIKQIENEVHGKNETKYVRSTIKGSFRQTYHRRARESRNSLVRILVILVILLLIFYLLFTI